MTIDLSIVVPCFNELYSIKKCLINLKKSFKNVSTEFIFVDDGSNDGTKEWLNNNVNKIFTSKNTKVINLDRNYGKGYAVRRGLFQSTGNYILFIDSDLEYNSNDAREMYEIIIKNNSIDVIFGSRYMGGKIQHRKHFFNDIAVRINTIIFNLLFGQSITDLHSGTKIIKKKVFNYIKLSLNDFGFEVDIATQIAKNNFKIYEYGISYFGRTRDEGKKITIIDGLLSYYYLFRSRFLINNIQTTISLIYATTFMFYVGTFFGMGSGKIIVVIFFTIIGSILGIYYKLISLTLIFFGIYVGSLFSAGNGRIYPIIFIFFVCIYFAKYFKIKKSLKGKKTISDFFI